MKNIPNLFTLLNLFFGCIAVIFILQNGIGILYSPDGAQYIGMPEKIWVASLFIGLAAVLANFKGFHVLDCLCAFGRIPISEFATETFGEGLRPFAKPVPDFLMSYFLLLGVRGN